MALPKPKPESIRHFLPFKSVLIVAESGFNVQDIADELKLKTYKPVKAEFNGQKLQGVPRHAPDAILICLDEHAGRAPTIFEALKQRYGTKNVPMIGVFADQVDLKGAGFDSVMFGHTHPSQVVHRVNSMIRLNIMQTEIALRMDTLREDFGIHYSLNDNAFSDRLRVLFIGKATPEFMVLINALESRNVEVVAAFTSFSAFDFLHESTFDAVVMNALTGSEPALSISQTMRRNAALYHTPSLLMTKPSFKDQENAYKHGVSDIIYSDAGEQDIQARILELARFHRLHRQVKAEFENIGKAQCQDESGLYTSKFFSLHLTRLVGTYSKQDLPVSLITVKADFDISNTKELAASKRAYNQLGNLIKNMVRVYDVTARLSHNIYVIAFPGQPATTLAPVIKRLSGISKAAEFGPNADGNKTFKVELTFDITELGHGITGNSWLAQQDMDEL